MASRRHPPAAGAPFPDLSTAMRDSAQEIWLAGLGAFTKAQAEGSKAFDSLVKEGMATQRSGQPGTEDRFRETAERMAGMAAELGSRAAAPWGKLEGIFEERVARAMVKLGAPTRDDVQALAERLDVLEQLARKASPSTKAPVKKPAAAARPKASPTSKKSSSAPASKRSTKVRKPG